MVANDCRLLVAAVSSVCVFATGCSPSVMKTTVMTPDMTEITETAQEQIPALFDSTFTVLEEESLLAQILESYDAAAVAHGEGNYALAETNLENAFQLIRDINIADIANEELQSRYRDALVMLGQEYGRILNESSVIAAEDPTAWLQEMDAEQFKSGKWTDDELKTIVLKIATKSDVPIEYNERVRNAIYYFQNGGRKSMTLWLQRSGRYLPMIQDILAEEGVPLDMAYLAMIESGLNPIANSPARAVGLWQFIYSTGKIYGLDRDQWVDERRDPIKATLAAARHLNDLYQITDDWNNVMAAYNCGPTRISSQLAETENIEYWDMQLPSETRNYVPSFMAAVVIVKAPELFGFENIEPDPLFEYDTVEVHPYTSLANAAKCAGVSVDAIKELNPELLQSHVPPGNEMYELRIPKSTSETFMVAYNALPVEKYELPQVTSVRVRPGETFSGIADRYRVSMTSLRAANPQITNINRLSVGDKINIPGSSTVVASASTVVASVGETSVYTIKKNDTLGKIAETYHTNVRTLQALNNMGSSTRIYVGQRLKVPAQGAASGTTIADASTSVITYTVQKNDTLYEIGRRYGVDYRKIMSDNNITDQRRLQPGQRLVIAR